MNKGKRSKTFLCSLSGSYQLTWEYIKCNVSMCLNMEYLIASKLRHSPNNIWGTIEHLKDKIGLQIHEKR